MRWKSHFSLLKILFQNILASGFPILPESFYLSRLNFARCRRLWTTGMSMLWHEDKDELKDILSRQMERVHNNWRNIVLSRKPATSPSFCISYNMLCFSCILNTLDNFRCMVFNRNLEDQGREDNWTQCWRNRNYFQGILLNFECFIFRNPWTSQNISICKPLLAISFNFLPVLCVFVITVFSL